MPPPEYELFAQRLSGVCYLISGLVGAKLPCPDRGAVAYASFLEELTIHAGRSFEQRDSWPSPEPEVIDPGKMDDEGVRGHAC